jgi:transcriptional regulator with XRE-family HTH domain
MTLGQIVKTARMKKGWTQKRLGKEVALGQASISALEHDELGSRLDAQTLIRIAEVLDESAILVHHCESCPIRIHLFEKRFGELKDKRQDLAALALQLRKEMGAAVATLEELSSLMSAADFRERSQKRAKAGELFAQISEIERGIGVLRFQMVLDDLL